MIELAFTRADEVVGIKIDGNDLQWGSSYYNLDAYFDMKSLKGLFVYDKVIKEHPDLEDIPTWRDEAYERFKALFKSLPTEKEKIDYIVKELGSQGYSLLSTKRPGWRPVKNGAA